MLDLQLARTALKFLINDTLQGNSNMNLKINTYGQGEEWVRSSIQGNSHPLTVAHSS